MITNINACFVALRSVGTVRSFHHCIAQNRLKGKIAALTASTEGIGLAIARRLAQEGAKVIISSRRQHKVDAALSTLQSEGLDVTGVACHVSKKEDRKKLFDKVEEMGGLDILVSNAAVNPIQGPVFVYEEDSWNKLFNVNVTASFLLAKEAFPYLKKRGGGNINFVSSISAYNTPVVGTGAYAISKTALLALTRVLANELGKDNVRVNCIAPGVIETHFGEYITKNEERNNIVTNIIPLNRIGTPEEVSGVVAFLVSDDARYITGETLVPAGGIFSRH